MHITQTSPHAIPPAQPIRPPYHQHPAANPSRAIEPTANLPLWAALERENARQGGTPCPPCHPRPLRVPPPRDPSDAPCSRPSYAMPRIGQIPISAPSPAAPPPPPPPMPTPRAALSPIGTRIDVFA